VPDDSDADVHELQMENDLLALEVESLRGRLEEGDDDLEVLDQITLARSEVERLRRADRDLRWLLTRLGTGPLGWLLRRRRGYRRLAERHLPEDLE